MGKQPSAVGVLNSMCSGPLDSRDSLFPVTGGGLVALYDCLYRSVKPD